MVLDGYHEILGVTAEIKLYKLNEMHDSVKA